MCNVQGPRLYPALANLPKDCMTATYLIRFVKQLVSVFSNCQPPFELRNSTPRPAIPSLHRLARRSPI